MSDPYVRVLLTVIAAALVVIAARGIGSPISVAHAAETMECRFSGPLEIRSIGRIDNEVKVKMEQAYGEAGSSSGNPMYFKQVQ